MKNFIRLFGLTTFVVVIGFSMIACDDDSGAKTDPDLNGTWISESGISTRVYKLDNGSFTESWAGMEIYKGSYTTKGDVITITITSVNGAFLSLELDDFDAAKWYTIAELVSAEFTTANTFVPETYTYSVSDDTLTITDEDGYKDIYIKQKS